LSRAYHLEVRVGFVSRIDQMIVISWHFSTFTRLVCLAFQKLERTGAE